MKFAGKFLVSGVFLLASALSGAAEGGAVAPKPDAAAPEKISIRIADGSRTPDGAMRAAALEHGLADPKLSISIEQTSPDEAFRKVAAGEADIALHPAVKKPETPGMLPVVTRPYARSATVFLVNAGNPVNGLSLAQLKNIYSGKIRDWKSITGSGYSIHLYAPDAALPGDALVRCLLRPGLLTSRIYRTRTAEEIPLLVSLNTHSLGLMPYARETALPENVRALKIGGVEPSRENLASGKYPLSEEIFITVSASPSADAAAFLKRLEGAAFLRQLNQNHLFR